jgi:hypothetical protein
MVEAGSGRYLFAVTRGLGDTDLAGVTGMRGAALALVRHRDLEAVVCDVDLAEFGEAALARNLEDLAWLEEVARAHNDVVFAAASRGTVAPMRLVTIYADDDSVRTRIEELHDRLTEALDRVEGRREWSVKVFTTASGPARADEDAPAAVGSGPGSGAAYLRRKREQATRRQAAREQSIELAGKVHDELAARAVATRQLAPQDPRLTGHTETMLLNGAYLVPIDEGEQFRATVDRLGTLHPELTLEVEGPWPPYSFATLD